ncbi:MAG: rod shape-determining protein MreC, partial [Actinobacteria bacterium]|nr:rod shape-determining protein MreC [Actinomycetota bacterium]NIS36421.1 rod shape-determining protein MreC [Actinomycetota bacterium]NIT98702.1 rod shape-determining protein MreC [Actinomycetota bacterium]NIU70935.1 rod shape-determining protein MreC [Actinomycetota bacterium]NIV90478.1 rod shape-determining protein MreC [Actinomycetota bacterium]
LERLEGLELAVEDLVRTNANVIGRTDSFDRSFRIDRGEESGVLVGHPVLDANGYLVGRVLEAW